MAQDRWGNVMETFSQVWQKTKSEKLAYYSWLVLFYTIGVIVWGAFVRATGSGAGCGSHWPTCNGDIIPRPGSMETMIELTHRATSSLLGVLSIGQLVWAARVYPARHRVRKAAWWAFGFTVFEGILGAGLVLFELVEDNTSTARAIVIGLHLINTMVLVACFTVTAWFASGGRPFDIRKKPLLAGTVGLALLGLLLVSAFGAVTALGNTLFPAETLAKGIAQDFDPEAHFAIRLRVWHPVLAIATSIYIVMFIRGGAVWRETRLRERLSYGVLGVVGAQVALGFVNVIFRAPVWMQLVHLALSNLLWISLLLLGTAVLAVPDTELASALEEKEAATDYEPNNTHSGRQVSSP